jgi:mannitol-1-/sugar-/sorbitol-6-phosphatase
MFAGRSFDAVLFDLDGTLIDSTSAVERIWQRWGTQYGLRPGCWTFHHGVPARQMLARLVPAGEVEAQFEVLERLEVSDLDGLAVLPGAAEALAALPAGRAAIATSGTAPLAKARIDRTGLAAPAVVVTASDTPIGKPHPAPYLLAAERLGVDPARCLVVEDAPAGLTAARAAGCATLAVATTHRAADLDADAVVPDLSAVRFETEPDGVRVRAAQAPGG